jgi:hypothetical protein
MAHKGISRGHQAGPSYDLKQHYPESYHLDILLLLSSVVAIALLFVAFSSAVLLFSLSHIRVTRVCLL